MIDFRKLEKYIFVFDVGLGLRKTAVSGKFSSGNIGHVYVRVLEPGGRPSGKGWSTAGVKPKTGMGDRG